MNEQYRNAIGTVESDNDYGALGPVTDKGDRAYGRYQVMGSNIPEWTRKHLGTEMTPDQFLADQNAQDKVFDAVTSGYHKKYGNLDDVTSSWFSGRPLAQAGNASDGYNTTPQYLAKVNKVMGGPVAAINSAAGIKDAQPGALTSAFAPKGDEGALNANNVIGPGALSGEPDKASVIGQGLSGIGASLAGITNPEQAKAITAQATLMKKAATDNGAWSIHVLPNGQVMRINSKTNATQILPGNFAKPEKDAGEEETKKLEAKAAADRFQTTQDAENVANEQLANIKLLRSAVTNPDVTFGGLGNAAATAKNIAYSMGLDVKGLTDTQVVEKVATQMQLAKGKLLPGAISNYEDQLMGKANGVGLDKSREANIAAIDAQEALYKHQLKLASEARKYKQEHGTLDDGWTTHRQQFAPAEAVPAPTVPAATATKPTNAFKTKSGVNWSY